MFKALLDHIIDDLKNLNSGVLLVENNDGFLFRDDIQSALINEGFTIDLGSQIQQRIAFELRDENSSLILLSKNKVSCLEDVEMNAKRIEFFLDKYLEGYHIPSLLVEAIGILDELYQQKQIIGLNKKETCKKIEELKATEGTGDSSIAELKVRFEKIKEDIDQEDIDWAIISLELGELIRSTIGTEFYYEINELIIQINEQFQEYREDKYHQTKVSNATKHPKNVCKILDYLDFNFKNEKIALVVVDGMKCLAI